MLRSLLIISDSFPNADGGGISQTLYNLFCAYPQKLWILLETHEEIPQNAAKLNAQVIRYKDAEPILWKNRFSKWVNPFLKVPQFTNRQFSKLPKGMPGKDEVWVLVSTTLPEKLHWACLLAKKGGYTVIPYFMDDWMAGKNHFWFGGSLSNITTYLLKKAKVRLMISEQLKEMLENRYHLATVPTYIVHNPCPLISQAFTETGNISNNESQIIYSGSVWPMHADALITFAKAIHLSNQSEKDRFKLDLYIPPEHWRKYSQQLSGPGIVYKGWLTYASVLKELPKAWMLLCTASFLPQYAQYTKSSVQTKLTDYMAAGRPIIVVGPVNAASGDWVVKRACGLHLQHPLPEHLLKDLRNWAQQPEHLRQLAENTRLLAAGQYAAKNVRENLYQFLASHL